MAKTGPAPVIVFFGDLMLHLDEDQASALLLRKQIIKCEDTRHEHYHLTHAAGLNATRGIAIDLRPVAEAMVANDISVSEWIDRCTKPGDKA